MAVVLDLVDGIDAARQRNNFGRSVGAVDGTGDIHPRRDAVRDAVEVPGFRAVDPQGFACGAG